MMSGATGLTAFEVAILEACAAVGAGADRPFAKTPQVLAALLERTGVGPRYGYEAACDLARPWVVHLTLLQMHGNFGTPDFGPADPEFTECRLSPLGSAALAAERSGNGPLPIGLINGDLHTGGRRPPLDPQRALAAIRSAAEGADDDELVGLVGVPAFPTGCDVRIDVPMWASGAAECEMVLSASFETVDATTLLISNLPPQRSAGGIAEEIAGAVHRAHPDGRRAIRDVQLQPHGYATDLAVTLTLDSEPLAVRDVLLSLRNVREEHRVSAGAPLGALVRTVAQGTDLEARLAPVEAAITS